MKIRRPILVALVLSLLLAPFAAAGLLYGTFVGGSGIEELVAVDVGEDGVITLLAENQSGGFPVTPGAYRQTGNGLTDIVVCKLSPDGSELLASTYVSGSSSSTDPIDNAYAMAVDNLGRPTVVGSTWSESWPTTAGAWASSLAGLQDIIIFQLSADLGSLIFSSYLSGGEYTFNAGMDIEIDDQGNYYFAGYYEEYDSASDYQAFVFKLAPNVSTVLEYAYILGNDGDRARDVDVMPNGNVVLLVETDSTDLEVSPDAWDNSWNGEGSSLILTYDSDLEPLRSTYVPSDHYASERHVLSQPGGSILVFMSVLGSGFPVSADAFDQTYHSGRDGYLLQLNGDLTEFQAGTYVGGAGHDWIHSAIIDSKGLIVLGGSTESLDFPVTPWQDDTLDGVRDGFVITLTNDLAESTFGTFFGGSSYDSVAGVTQGQNECLVVAGKTNSVDFPVTGGAYDQSLDELSDLFVAVIDFTPWFRPLLVTGCGPAGWNPPRVRLFTVDENPVSAGEFDAYGTPAFGVQVACGDLDGNGLDEILTGPGPGDVFGPHVRGFTGAGDPLPGLSFLAYGTPRFGVNVTAGDIDGDGVDEIVTGAGPGAVFGPHVRGFEYDGQSVSPISGVSYFAYGTPKWGVNVAAGDIDGDGFDEIVTGAGPGLIYGPHVRGWDVDGAAVAAIAAASWLAYGSNHYGVSVACGDIDGDGLDEIMTAPGPSPAFGTHLRGWDFDGAAVQPISGCSFFAWPPGDLAYGARVSCRTDLDFDGRNEIVAGAGPDPAAGTPVKVFRYDGETVSEWIGFTAYPPEFAEGGVATSGKFNREH